MPAMPIEFCLPKSGKARAKVFAAADRVPEDAAAPGYTAWIEAGAADTGEVFGDTLQLVYASSGATIKEAPAGGCWGFKSVTKYRVEILATLINVEGRPVVPIMLKLRSLGINDYSVLEGGQRIGRDVNTEFADYWLWSPKGTGYRNRLPFEIVQIFEKYRFIWGGKWEHFDTMHFEYRPELLD
jgi:D-alanyl-D-alanine carboxypeptidase